MIGKINNHQPCSLTNNYTPLGKQPLKNQINGSVINVININADFRIVSKELSLYREVKDNPRLVTFVDTKLHNSQSARFSSLGMAVTAIDNLFENGKAKGKSVDICNENPRNKLVEFIYDISINKRGLEYINQFLDAKTPLDSTNYAIGLRVGSDMKNNVLDHIMINQFNTTWEIRLGQTR